ncbi:MAG: hypothetical protein EXS13_06190 [Planctomycetes bacterium]|nr:hypothetical protein [Planctomycetota bacterium]
MPIQAAQVIRLEARGDYVAVHAKDGESLLHVTIPSASRASIAPTSSTSTTSRRCTPATTAACW